MERLAREVVAAAVTSVPPQILVCKVHSADVRRGSDGTPVGATNVSVEVGDQVLLCRTWTSNFDVVVAAQGAWVIGRKAVVFVLGKELIPDCILITG